MKKTRLPDVGGVRRGRCRGCRGCRAGGRRQRRHGAAFERGAVVTQAEFRQVHEIVKGVKFDASNFNKRFRRMVSDGYITKTGGRRPTAGRYNAFYRIENA